VFSLITCRLHFAYADMPPPSLNAGARRDERAHAETFANADGKSFPLPLANDSAVPSCFGNE
jgi:hypothetical protein